jgi:hypothetical protein
VSSNAQTRISDWHVLEGLGSAIASARVAGVRMSAHPTEKNHHAVHTIAVILLMAWLLGLQDQGSGGNCEERDDH